MWTILIDSVSWVIIAVICPTVAVMGYRLCGRIKRGI